MEDSDPISPNPEPISNDGDGAMANADPPTPDAPIPDTPPASPAAQISDSQANRLFGVGWEELEDLPTRPSWRPPSAEALQAVLPQYEVTSFIARGGMGAVYKGVQKALRRTVAIKILPPGADEGHDLHFAERFKLEAQSMARLSHPGIVAVYDAGETATGLLFFVMEFVEGTDLQQFIRKQGRLLPEQAIALTAHICDALAFAHEEGIVHRDIKPSNVMLDKRGRVKVADFGLAKAMNLESLMLTRSDVAVGSPDFVAPEAMIPGVKVDHRADLYAVGVMFYEMLTGKIPRGRFHLPSAVVPQLDPRLDEIVDKAMQPDPKHRYASAIEMRADLDRVAARPVAPAGQTSSAIERPLMSVASSGSGTSPGTKPPTAVPLPVAGPEQPNQKNGTVALIGGAIALGAAAIYLWFTVFGDQTGQPGADSDRATENLSVTPHPDETAGQAGTGAGPVAIKHLVAPEPSTQQPPPPTDRDGERAEAAWKARWSKPGQLRAVGVDLKGAPIDLKVAEPYADFVQVSSFVYQPYNGRIWAALRANGQLLWSDGTVDEGCVGVAGSSPILQGGRAVTPFIQPPLEPVQNISVAECTALPNKPKVMAYQRVDGTWKITSTAFASGDLEQPDVTSPPAVKKVRVEAFGTAVLREDGSFRLWAVKEVSLPRELATGVRDIVELGSQWAVLKEDGSVPRFTVAAPTPSRPSTSSQVANIQSCASRIEAITTASYSTKPDAGGVQPTPPAGPDDEALVAALRTIEDNDIKHYCATSSEGKAAVIWIEPPGTKKRPVTPPQKPKEREIAKPKPAARPVNDGTVEGHWKSRWHGPGRLHAAGTDLHGLPFDLEPAKRYSDFVQVLALDPSKNQGRTWAALRSNGDLVTSDGLVQSGKLALIRCEQEFKTVGGGGWVQTLAVDGPSTPVSDFVHARVAFLPNTPVLIAFADGAGNWRASSPAFGSRAMERPDLTSPPKVTSVVTGAAGLGVLRADGSLRIWNVREMQLPDSIGKNVRAVVPLTNTWAVLKADGSVFRVALSKQVGISIKVSSQPVSVEQIGTEMTAIAGGGFSVAMKRSDGRWTVGAPGVVEAVLTKLHEQENESFSMTRSAPQTAEVREGILWIE